MHDQEKSDSAIVAVKPSNKAGTPAAEAVGAKGGDQGERGPAKHAPDPEPAASVTQALGRVRQAPQRRFAVTPPR